MMAADIHGNLFLPDFDSSGRFLIRKINSEGFVSTIKLEDNTGVPNGDDQNTKYLSPIAVDNIGNLYFTARHNTTIKKADINGKVTVLAGSGNGVDDGQGEAAKFNGITSLIVDEKGNIYASDAGNNAIRKITSDGLVSTIAGITKSAGYKDGTGDIAKFYYPCGLAIDKKGAIYVADLKNNRIRKIEYK